MPQTRECGCLVAGRGTPTGEYRAPASAAPDWSTCAIARLSSPGQLEGIGGLVELQTGHRVRGTHHVDHVREPAHLLIEDQGNPVAQVSPGARDNIPQRAGAEQRGEQ